MTATADTEVPSMEIRILDATDRCDGCGAQAMVAVDLHGTELLFCAHHANAGMDKIRGHITLVHEDATVTTERVTAKS